MPTNIALRDYQAGDRPQIFSLMEEIYDADVMANSRSHWEWQYHENPRNPDGRVAIRVVDRDGEIVATICGVRQLFWVDGVVVPGLWVVDFMARQAGTNERERHRFGKRLAIELRDTQPLVAGVNRPSLNRYWKRILGEQIDICAVPMMVRALRGDRVARAKVSSAPLKAVAGIAGTLARPLMFRTRARANDPNATIEVVDRFDDEYDAFFQAVAPTFQQLAVRDSAYLTWRYFDIPCRTYRVLALRRAGQLAGWIVTRELASDGLRKGRIVDMLARRDDGDAWYRLLHAVVEHFEDEGADLVHGLGATEPAVMQAYRDCGFRLNPEHARSSQYIAYTKADGVNADSFYDGDHWFVTLGDSDTDFASLV